MAVLKYALIVIGVLLLVIWIASAVSIYAGVRRRLARVPHAGPRAKPLSIEALAGIPSAALMLTVNLVVFVVALCWYRLRGKPLPPPPKR